MSGRASHRQPPLALALLACRLIYSAANTRRRAASLWMLMRPSWAPHTNVSPPFALSLFGGCFPAPLPSPSFSRDDQLLTNCYPALHHRGAVSALELGGSPAPSLCSSSAAASLFSLSLSLGFLSGEASASVKEWKCKKKKKKWISDCSGAVLLPLFGAVIPPSRGEKRKFTCYDAVTHTERCVIAESGLKCGPTTWFFVA